MPIKNFVVERFEEDAQGNLEAIDVNGKRMLLNFSMIIIRDQNEDWDFMVYNAADKHLNTPIFRFNESQILDPAHVDADDLYTQLKAFRPFFFNAPVIEFVDLRLIFGETFTGDGVTTQFQLDGTLINAQITKGNWLVGRIINLLQASIVRNDNKKPTYDSVPNFLGNRISVLSISPTGLVTLSHPPRTGIDFDIWYWYELLPDNEITDYTREDIVSSMEADNSRIDQKIDQLLRQKNDTGFVRIQDNTDTDLSPQLILTGVESQFIVNRDNVFNQESPDEVNDNLIWSSSNIFFPQNVGDIWDITLELTANPDQNNRNFDIILRENGVTEIGRRLSRLARGAGNETPYRTTSQIAIINSSWVTNGITIHVLCDGDVDIFDKSLILTRVHKSKLAP